MALGRVDTIQKMCCNSSYSSETLRISFLKEEARVGWRKVRSREASVFEGQARSLFTPPQGKEWIRKIPQSRTQRLRGDLRAGLAGLRGFTGSTFSFGAKSRKPETQMYLHSMY